MILDGKNNFSALDTGDTQAALTLAIGDTGSTYSIDQNPKGGSFSTVAAGGGYVNPMFLVCRVHAAVTSASNAATVQFVLQESVDNSVWTDISVSPAFTCAQLVAYLAFAIRLPQTRKQYIRVAYRVAGENLTAGTFHCFLTPDIDMIDLYQRLATGYVSAPSGATDQSMPASVTGVLDN